MNNFERYSLLILLSFFFSFMVLGMVGIYKSQNVKNDQLQAFVFERLNNQFDQLQANARNCFQGKGLTQFLDEQSSAHSMMRFLTANMDDGRQVDIYVNNRPDSNGAFFAMKMEPFTGGGVKKGCVIARGSGMKVAMPFPTAGQEIRLPIESQVPVIQSETTPEKKALEALQKTKKVTEPEANEAN